MEDKVEYQTSEISELVKALCKAKKDFKNITRDGKNPFLNSKYVTLDAIINATEDALSNNGLIIMHHQELIDNNKFLVTELIHESGQIKSTETCMNEYITVQTNERGNAKVTPIQIFGSIITYLKRYHIGELLNVAIDEDIDGNGPTDRGKQTGTTTQNNPTENNADNLDRISEIEINQILSDCKQMGFETETQALNKVISILKKNLKSLSEITMPEYATVIKSLGSTKVPASNGGGTTDVDKNRKRAFAIANKLLINDEQISEYVLLTFSHESRKNMTEEQWNQYCDYLIEYEKKAVTDEQIAEMKALPKPYTDATLPNFLEFVNSNLITAKEKTKDIKGNKVVHTPVTKLEHMQIWEADYIIRILKANPKE
jgi:hypothetical protein